MRASESVASKERFIHHFIAAVTISCRPPSSAHRMFQGKFFKFHTTLH